jgi:C-terminal processing protease CtpA/Prc
LFIKIIKKNRIQRLTALVFCVVIMGGCAAIEARWTGTVDTVFQYKAKEARTVVYEVREGSLSRAAGILPGDVLLAVDGEDVSSVAYEAVRAALRGPVGTQAVLTIKRDSEIIEYRVERLPVGQGN